MAEPVDPRIIAARLNPNVGPVEPQQPGGAKPPSLEPGQPTFAETLEGASERLKDAETKIPDPSSAKDATDVESLNKQLGALHEMTMDAHRIISQLGQQLVNPQQSESGENPEEETER